MLRSILALMLITLSTSAEAETLHVPKDYETIQAAIDTAKSGDTVLVVAGTYHERIQLKPGIVVRSVGDDTNGAIGMKRAELTILDGGGKDGEEAGVLMAEGSTLDGFTITRIGVFDKAVWKKHFDSQGEELGDDEGSVQAEGTIPAVSIRGVNCTVINNIVHHNGDVGIAAIGREGERSVPLIAFNFSYRNMGGGIGVADLAQPIIRENSCYENLRAGIGCRNSSPIIQDNKCFKNIRAGIGCREGARPIMRGNKCYQNRRAGIGIRMKHTAPVVENNECYENEMAGIGNRDGAEPTIRNNQCFKNKMAGIGCDGSKPLIIGNECRENLTAGIGLRGKAIATIQNNRCLENKLVAVGVTQKSTATICGNHLTRSGGVPPIIAVKDGSIATIKNNVIKGGGVAAVLVQGNVRVNENTFVGAGAKQGNAVWVWEGSSAIVSDNSFDGYRAAVNASKSTMTVTGNTIERFQRTAIVVKDSRKPAHVYGNKATTVDPKAKVVDVQGASGVVESNKLLNGE